MQYPPGGADRGVCLAGGKVHFWLLGILAAPAYLVQLSSSVFGISGLRWYRKKGMLSEGAQAVAVAAQFVPCVDIVGTILCCALLGRKEKDEDQKANAAA